ASVAATAPCSGSRWMARRAPRCTAGTGPLPPAPCAAPPRGLSWAAIRHARRTAEHHAHPAGATMNLTKPRVLLLSLAIAAAVAACSNQSDEAAPAGQASQAAANADRGGLQLDEGSLPGVNRFQAS